MAYVEVLAFIDLKSIVSENELMEILDVDEVCAMEFMSGVIALTEEELTIIAESKGIELNDLPLKILEPTGKTVGEPKDDRVTFTYYGDFNFRG